MIPLAIQGHIIPWGQLQSGSYLYGVDIRRLAGNRISYKQDYLPVGTIIHSWHSMTNYQGDRDIPQLPRLRRNQEYTLCLLLESKGTNAPYVRLSFYNRRKELLNQQIIKGISGKFTYPARAYSYKIELINVSCTAFIFNNLLILEDNQSMANELPYYSQLIEEETTSDELAILFLESDRGVGLTLSEKFLSTYKSVLVFANLSIDPAAYMTDDFISYQKTKLESILETHPSQSINWIGYGKRSNQAACFFHDYYQKGQLFINRQVDFDSLREDSQRQDLSELQAFLNKSKKYAEIVPYQKASDSDLPDFFSQLIDQSFTLEKLVEHEK
ncbi:accessory Sec system protein Asp3 [Streptococcus hongkongensis]